MELNFEDTEANFAEHNYYIRASGSDGQSVFTKRSNKGSRAHWSSYNILQDGSVDHELDDAAIIAGRPAFVYHNGTSLHYACANNAEPADGDWTITNLTNQLGTLRCRLVEHAGRPWIIYPDAIGAPRICFADTPYPQDDGAWDSFSLYGNPADNAGYAMADVNGLLQVLVQDQVADGGALLLFSATEVEMQNNSSWVANLIDLDISDSATFEIGQVGTDIAILYEDANDLRYAWTSDMTPDVNAWTFTTLPKAQNQTVVQQVHLAVDPDGLPTGVYNYAVGSPSKFVGYVYSAVAQPTQDADWALSTSVVTPALSMATDLGYFNGLPYICWGRTNQDTGITQGLVPRPGDASDGWNTYFLQEFVSSRQPRLDFRAMDLLGRPLVMYAEKDNATGDGYVRYFRMDE